MQIPAFATLAVTAEDAPSSAPGATAAPAQGLGDGFARAFSDTPASDPAHARDGRSLTEMKGRMAGGSAPAAPGGGLGPDGRVAASAIARYAARFGAAGLETSAEASPHAEQGEGGDIVPAGAEVRPEEPTGLGMPSAAPIVTPTAQATGESVNGYVRLETGGVDDLSDARQARSKRSSPGDAGIIGPPDPVAGAAEAGAGHEKADLVPTAPVYAAVFPGSLPGGAMQRTAAADEPVPALVAGSTSALRPVSRHDAALPAKLAAHDTIVRETNTPLARLTVPGDAQGRSDLPEGASSPLRAEPPSAKPAPLPLEVSGRETETEGPGATYPSRDSRAGPSRGGEHGFEKQTLASSSLADAEWLPELGREALKVHALTSETLRATKPTQALESGVPEVIPPLAQAPASDSTKAQPKAAPEGEADTNAPSGSVSVDQMRNTAQAAPDRLRATFSESGPVLDELAFSGRRRGAEPVAGAALAPKVDVKAAASSQLLSEVFLRADMQPSVAVSPGDLDRSEVPPDGVFSEARAATVQAPASQLPAAGATADLARSVAVQIVEAITASRERAIELHLNPEDLGRVSVTLSGDNGAISVALVAERGETLDLMRRNIDILADDLRRLGYGSVSFSFGEGRQGSGGLRDHAPPLSAGQPDGSEPEARGGLPAPSSGTRTGRGIDIRI